jgi:acyl-CoA hydrolase
VAYFFSGATRPGFREGVVDFTPSYFSEMPQLIDRGLMPAEVVFTQASPMDEHGYFSLGLAPDYTMAAIRKARAVVSKSTRTCPSPSATATSTSPRSPRWSRTTSPCSRSACPPSGPVQEAIGKYVADMIDDGSTLQIGYGGIPDAVVMQLTHKQDLGIHTEMIGDGILTLIEAGAVTNRRKNFMPGKMVATFALGSKKLYDFMHRNPMVEMHPVDFTNDPYWPARTTT